MLKFLLYAVIAYFIYQFIITMDWDGMFSSTTRGAQNAAGNTYQGIRHSSVIETLEDALKALKDVIGF